MPPCSIHVGTRGDSSSDDGSWTQGLLSAGLLVGKAVKKDISSGGSCCQQDGGRRNQQGSRLLETRHWAIGAKAKPGATLTSQHLGLFFWDLTTQDSRDKQSQL